MCWVEGAWASFGPGQFSTLFHALTRPAAGGRLHFAGEAASIRHSSVSPESYYVPCACSLVKYCRWIVGTLDSSWRAVAEILLLSHREKIPEFLALWGHNPEYCVDGDPKLIISYLAACEPTLFDLLKETQIGHSF